MNELLESIVSVILIPLLPSVAILFGLLVKKYSEKLAEEIKLNKESRVALRLSEATKAVVEAVQYTTQTYVEYMKKNNAFDLTAQKEALLLSKQKALLLMNDSAKHLIIEISGDLDAWLDTMIESKTLELKDWVMPVEKIPVES